MGVVETGKEEGFRVRAISADYTVTAVHFLNPLELGWRAALLYIGK